MVAPPLVVSCPETMNLLGLILAAILRRNATGGARVPARGVLGITAGSMSCTVEFAPDAITIRRGRPATAKARLAADLETLVDLARSPVAGSARALARRRLRFSGNPIFLLSMFPLLRA